MGLTACAGDDSSGSSFAGLTFPTGASTPGTSAGTEGTDGTSGATDAPEPTGGGGASTGSDPTATSGATEDSADPTDPTAPNPDGLPNGSECTDPAQCMTGNCYKIPLPVDGLPPGICSECDADLDCVAADLGTACTVDAMTLAAKCSYGEAGSFCESQAACQNDLFCVALLDGADGLLPHTCSECRTDADCGGGGLRCVAELDVVTYSGVKHCAVPGSVGKGGLCPLTDGDAMCATGKCAVFNVLGNLDVGVCGDCKTDADCGMGQTCTPPKFKDGFVASTCM